MSDIANAYYVNAAAAVNKGVSGSDALKATTICIIEMTDGALYVGDATLYDTTDDTARHQAAYAVAAAKIPVDVTPVGAEPAVAEAQPEPAAEAAAEPAVEATPVEEPAPVAETPAEPEAAAPDAPAETEEAPAADTVTASAGEDSVAAPAGNDTIDASAGNDTLDAGATPDTTKAK